MLDDAEDPARLFFPDDSNVDLYEVLNLKQEDQPSDDAIKKAYRKLALRYHPDKARLHQGDPEAVALRFQQIGFAYSVLSDAKRRKKYDATGSTNDSIWDSDEPVDWNEYFKTLWTGEVSAKTLAEFQASYQGTYTDLTSGSSEERHDILQAYRTHKGQLEGIFSEVPCSNILEDEERFITIINHALQAKEIPTTKAWTALQAPGGSKTRKKLRAKAQQEASEAEAYAKELGVWDDLYGPSTTKKRKAVREEPTTATPPNEAKAQADDDEVDLDALRQAMRAKATQRASSFDAMIERLEHKHARPAGSAKKPSKKRRG